MKFTYVVLAFCGLLSSSLLFGGGLEKGLESLQKKDFYGAKKQFEKILFKKPIGANYGLSLVHYEKQNPFYDIDRALRYCNNADSAYQFGLQKDRDALSELGIDGNAIKDLRKRIGVRAFDDLMEDPTDDRIAYFLDTYKFSARYGDVVQIRDQIAFDRAEEQDSYESYRQFIIDYPGSEQRAKADSLYALKFFEVKTSSGSIEGYQQFVIEFPANPYSDQAYDTLYNYVLMTASYKAFHDYIFDYPDNKNTREAWRCLNLICLRNYSSKTISNMTANLRRNPFKEILQKELLLVTAKRFVMKIPDGKVVVGIDGKLYGKTYDEIMPFQEGLAKVIRNGKSGFINKLGEEIIPLKYDDAFDMSSGLAVVERNGKFGAVDRFGSVTVPFVYDELGNANYGLLAFEKNSGSGFVDWTGRERFNRTFEYASDFSDGHAIIAVEGLYGAIDTLGSFTIPALYDWVEESRNGYSRVRMTEMMGLYHHGIGLEIPIMYEKIGMLGSGLYAFVSEGKLGYLDKDGGVAISPTFEFAPERMAEVIFRNNHTVATVNGKKGLIDTQGEFIIPAKYDELQYSGESILIYRLKNRWGLIKVDGTKIPGLYDFAGPYSQGLVVVEKNGLKGLVNSSGSVVLPPQYEYLEPIMDTELIIYSQEGLKGIISRDREVFLDPRFDDIVPFNIRFAKLTLQGQDQLYDLMDAEVRWSSVVR